MLRIEAFIGAPRPSLLIRPSLVMRAVAAGRDQNALPRTARRRRATGMRPVNPRLGSRRQKGLTMRPIGIIRKPQVRLLSGFNAPGRFRNPIS